MPSKIMHSNFNFKKAYGSVNSKRAHPASRTFVILSVPVVGICEKTSAQGWGKLKDRLQTRRSFFNISPKIVPI